MSADQIVAVGTLLVALGGLLTILINGYVQIKTLQYTRGVVDQINHAVNGTELGDPALVENIQDLHDEQFKNAPIAPLVRHLAAQQRKADRS